MNEDRIQQETLPFLMNNLPQMCMEKALNELNESKEKIILGLQELKGMTKVHKTTCGIDFTDDFLLQFLRHRKYNIQRAFQQLVNFTQFRKNYSSLFESIDSKLFASPCMRYFTVLPHRCPDGCTIVLVELGKWNPELVSFEDVKRSIIILFSQSLRDPMTQINGIKIIYDFTNTSLSHLKYCTPHNLYLLYHGGMDCFPGRYKAVHLVNNSPVLRAAWAVGRAFVTQKLKKRIILNSSPEDLLQHFPSSVLPVQYGGTLKNYHMTEWIKEANEQQMKFTLGGQANYY